LLLLINDTQHTRGLLPGKLFEYLAARRPILGIGSETGDAAQLISKSRGGEVIDFLDKDRIQSRLSEYYDQYLDGSLAAPIQNTDYEQYARRNLGKAYAQLVKETISNKASHTS
jgi:hypothetical protein